MSFASRLSDRVWSRRGLVGKLLWLIVWPTSLCFAVVVWLRRRLYALKLRRPARAAIAVVSVGNLSVGGTGKTPLALWLAQQLLARGWRVAIVLRGYGGSSAGPTVVGKRGEVLASVAVAGDEAVMLAKRFAGVVIAAHERLAGVREAETLGCDLVVLDDAFQHLRLARDVDLVLVGADPGSLLPAGPYREPRSALASADAVLAVDKGEGAPRLPKWLARPVFNVQFRAVSLVESDRGVWREHPMGMLAGRRVASVCAIGNPEAFQREVRSWEAELHEIVALDDHHIYTVEDWRQIANRTRQVDLVLTTEKDLVKLEQFPFERGKLLALRLAAEVEGGEELIDLVEQRLESPSQGGEDGNQSGTA